MHTPSKTHRTGCEAGFILPLTTIFLVTFVTLSISFGVSARGQVEIAKESRSAFQVEMAVHSGHDYAVGQIGGNPNWSGTDPNGIALDPQTSFVVGRLAPGTLGLPGNPIELEISGQSDDSFMRFQTALASESGDLLDRNALAVLGGTARMRFCDIDGNMLLTDQLDVVMDFKPQPEDPESGSWVDGGVSALGALGMSDVTADELFKYSANSYLEPGCQETQISEKSYTPGWSLEEYLVPGPDRVILEGVTYLANQVFAETVVFVLDPEETLTLENVHLEGGAIVMVDSEYDLRGGPRNHVVLRKFCEIGKRDSGVYPHIGLIAPGASVSTDVPWGSRIYGFNYWNDAGTEAGEVLNCVHVNGQLVIHNSVYGMINSSLVFDPAVPANLPGDIYFHGGSARLDVVLYREAFDSLNN